MLQPIMKVNEIRKKIDRVDRRILGEISERAKLVKAIGALKVKAGADVYVPHREKNIVSRLIKRNRGPLAPPAVESIFREIVNACRSLEKKLTVAYFGPEATYTHQAAMKNFGAGAAFVPVRTIADVFTEVEKGRANYGVVPIENSTEGIINHTLDMFVDSDLVICSEVSLPIEHCLLSLSGDMSKIKKLYSHTQPLLQCRNWIERNLPSAAVVEASSTAEAARCASKDASAAAIASKAAAQAYGLEIISEGIEDSKENFTRFLVIGTTTAQYSGQDKTSVMFSIKDKVGALHDMLMPFKKNGITLTKIESRPTRKKAWEYIFFIDFLGHVSEKGVQKALAELGRQCIFLKVLGSYPKAE